MRAPGAVLVLAGCSFPTSGGIEAAAEIDASSSRQPLDGGAGTDGAAPDDAGPADARTCGQAYAPVTGAPITSRYRAVEVGGGLVAALATCAAETTHVVIPETVEEAAAVYAFVANTFSGESPYLRVGVGRASADGAWTDALGRPFVVPQWGSMQPNESGAACLLVDGVGAFFDYSCNTAESFACECE